MAPPKSSATKNPKPPARKRPPPVEDEPETPRTPSKKPKNAQDDSEEFNMSVEQSVAEMVLPGRNRFESCAEHAHPPWNKQSNTLQMAGCMHKCEVCGENLPRNMVRHVKNNHCYDPTGTIKTIETAPDGKAVFWDVNMVSGPRKGGQKTFVLDQDDDSIMQRAAQITKAGTAEGAHNLNKTQMALVNLQTRMWKMNPVTGKPGAGYVRNQNIQKRAKAAAEAKRNGESGRLNPGTG